MRVCVPPPSNLVVSFITDLASRCCQASIQSMQIGFSRIAGLEVCTEKAGSHVSRLVGRQYCLLLDS